MEGAAGERHLEHELRLQRPLDMDVELRFWELADEGFAYASGPVRDRHVSDVMNVTPGRSKQ